MFFSVYFLVYLFEKSFPRLFVCLFSVLRHSRSSGIYLPANQAALKAHLKLMCWPGKSKSEVTASASISTDLVRLPALTVWIFRNLIKRMQYFPRSWESGYDVWTSRTRRGRIRMGMLNSWRQLDIDKSRLNRRQLLPKQNLQVWESYRIFVASVTLIYKQIEISLVLGDRSRGWDSSFMIYNGDWGTNGDNGVQWKCSLTNRRLNLACWCLSWMSVMLRSYVLPHAHLLSWVLCFHVTVALRLAGEPNYRFYCEICSAGFNYSQNLIRHKRCSHGLSDKHEWFYCHTCGQGFARKDVFKRHLKSQSHALRSSGLEKIYENNDGE